MSGEGHRDWLGDCDFHPRGTHLATASGDGTVKVWDFSKGVCTITLSDHTLAVWSCAFHDQGEFLVSGSMDHTSKIWDLNTRQTFHGHTDSVNHVSWMPYTNVVVTAACDKTVCLWDGRTGTCTQTLYGHGNAVNCAVFSLQADKLATCDASGFLKLWDVRNLYAELDMVDLGPHPSNRLCFDPSGTITAVASNEGAVKLWNAHERFRPGRDVVNPSLAGSAPNPVQAVAFDKTAEHLVAGGADGGINIFS
ncbi:MAG: WD40-repeat-containing domain protein, partial [Olpidium bornovanus]